VVAAVVAGAAVLAVVGAVLDPVEARARAVPEGTAAAQPRRVIQARRVTETIPAVRGRLGLVQMLAGPIRTRIGELTRMIPISKI
jgi:hypothetical protein